MRNQLPVVVSQVGTRLRTIAEQLLARADLAVVHRSNYEHWLEQERPSHQTAVAPPGANTDLRLDHPRLLELQERYRSHPAASSSVWSEDTIRTQLDPRYFRGDSPYVWQRRLNTQPANYAVSTMYVEQHDPLGLLDRLREDELFGVHTYEVGGHLVSRDLLDSIVELTTLEEELGLSARSTPTILDIGAGYGRLAHRATAAFDLTYLCADGVPLSTFLSDYYLRYRGARGAEVLPLDEVSGTLKDRHVDIAVNVHSFSECPLEAIEWWIGLLGETDVDALMIVPNGDELLSTERSGSRVPFLPLLEAQGFRMTEKRPKYAHSALAQQYGIYPAHHFLFRRT